MRLLVEYLYLLDYEPLTVQVQFEDSSSQSDTMSSGQYGHVYGTSAISAFGGPQSPFSVPFRNVTESSLTVHALPIGDYHGGLNRPDNRRTKSNRSMAGAPPEPSPLATNEPHLTLHARMYAAGHKYGIDGLKALALDKFKIQVTRHWFVKRTRLSDSQTPSTNRCSGSPPILQKRSTKYIIPHRRQIRIVCIPLGA